MIQQGRQRQSYPCFRGIHRRKRAPAVCRRKMLQFRRAHRRTMTYRMAKIQTVPGARRSEERVVKQKSCEDKANPVAAPQSDNYPWMLKRTVHPELFRTIVGLPWRVKRLPRCGFRLDLRVKGGEGTGARGATGPRGRTLREDDLVSVAAGSHIGMTRL